MEIISSDDSEEVVQDFVCCQTWMHLFECVSNGLLFDGDNETDKDKIDAGLSVARIKHGVHFENNQGPMLTHTEDGSFRGSNMRVYLQGTVPKKVVSIILSQDSVLIYIIV